MPDHSQVLRFAVGSATGPRARTWRLWVPKGKSDVYISSRVLGASVKASLHEGTSRLALTREWVRRNEYRAPDGRNSRLGYEWERPRPRPGLAARPFAIIVPWDEVRDQKREETGDVVWVPPPPEGTCVHFDVVFTPAGVTVIGYPGANKGHGLVGEVVLENTEHAFVTWIVRPMEDVTRQHIEKLRSARILNAEGNAIERTAMLAFGCEPNPDADDGTYVGSLLDVTRPDA